MTARRKLIALLLNGSGLSDDYQGTLRRGVEQACIEHDINLRVYAGQADWTFTPIQRRIYELLAPEDVDGIVLAAGCVAVCASVEDSVSDVQARCPVPMCAVSQRTTGVASILVDNFNGACTLVRHVVGDHDRRRVAYVAGPARHEESQERLAGTRYGLMTLGIELPADWVFHGDFSFGSGFRGAISLLDAHPNLDTIIAASDDMADGVIEALHSLGVPCPSDVAVAGFDDAVSARLARIPVTTVRQPILRAGISAVHHIVGQWQHRPLFGEVVLETELVVRESCGCRTSDALTAPDVVNPDDASAAFQPAEFADLLRPLLENDERRDKWARQLCLGAEAEQNGKRGALTQVVRELLDSIPESHLPIHALQRVITRMRSRSTGADHTSALEDAFHAARAEIGGQAYRRVGEQLMRNQLLLTNVRLGWERLATSLSLKSLRDALFKELPRVDIENAVVSLYDPDDDDVLLPLACLEGGQPVDPKEESYPAKRLVPDALFNFPDRRTLTILPLTFETERLGVAIFEFPTRLETYNLLREQIGSVIKAAHLHEEVLHQERLHSLAEEEKRTATERLKSLSLIAGGVAHDLNNVLGPLLALPDAILRNLDHALDPDRLQEVREDVSTIREAAHRAALTIRDLLAFGRPDDLETSPVNVNPLLRREQPALARLFSDAPGIEFRLVVSKERLVVRASRTHLARAISNLVINAIDAIPEASTGAVIVSSREECVTEKIPGHEYIEPGTYAVIAVEDNGLGIEREHLGRVLDPFFTAKQRTDRRGTGLGLAIVHRFVKSSQGYIRIDSTPGVGSTFSLYFPIVESIATVSSAPPPQVTGGKERVLVIDDEIVQLRTARRILAQLGYSVATVPSGDEAVLMYRQLPAHEYFDLVIADMMMPGTHNGISTIEEIRRIRPSQKALIASGHAPEEMDRVALERGLGWLAKPYSFALLASTVRNVLDAG